MWHIYMCIRVPSSYFFQHFGHIPISSNILEKIPIFAIFSCFLSSAIDLTYCNHPIQMSVCGCIDGRVGTFVRMCDSNYLFTFGNSNHPVVVICIICIL